MGAGGSAHPELCASTTWARTESAQAEVQTHPWTFCVTPQKSRSSADRHMSQLQLSDERAMQLQDKPRLHRILSQAMHMAPARG